MPFPPSFDHAWDITQPPDTQLANLLGQDIRNLKDDVMQRFSLMSGLAANKPTPETVNATWGGVGYGILFFETDTGKIWQWSGAGPAWVDISGSIGLPRQPFLTGVIQSPSGAQNTYVWRANFACTCVHLWGLVDGATGSVINAAHNGVAMFSNLTLGVADAFVDGGAASVAFAVGDSLRLDLVSVSGSPNYIMWNVYFTRP
jgi:hypothetical protein